MDKRRVGKHPMRARLLDSLFGLLHSRSALRGVSDTQDERRIVTELRSPLQWFSCASEFFSPENLGNVWLASPPSVLGLSRDHRVFGSWKPPPFFSKQQGFSSLALRRHLSVLLLRLPRPPPSHVDHGPERTVPRISFSALQHFRKQKPFFSLPGSPEAA
jgi:hypothetical protein